MGEGEEVLQSAKTKRRVVGLGLWRVEQMCLCAEDAWVWEGLWDGGAGSVIAKTHEYVSGPSQASAGTAVTLRQDITRALAEFYGTACACEHDVRSTFAV